MATKKEKVVKRPIFYEILGVAPDSTAAQIKTAYRKKARENHPDKNQGDPEAAERFKQILAAYQILKDPKKRKEYDNLGDKKVKLFSTPDVGDMSNVSPEAMAAMLKVQLEALSGGQMAGLACIVCCLFSLLWIFPVFLCLRSDDTVHWNWAVVFIPVWVLDVLLLLYLFLADPADQKTLTKFVWATSLVLFIAQQIFLVLRLESTVDWPWITVFLPWAFLELIGMWNELQGVHEKFFKFHRVRSADKADMMYSSNLFIFMAWRCSDHLARLCFAITLGLKLDDSIHANWFVVFVPLWIMFAFQVLFLCWRRKVMKPPETEAEKSHVDEDAPDEADSAAAICMNTCRGLLLFVTCIVLAAKLASHTDKFSAFYVMLPIMSPVFGVCCLFSCATCCLGLGFQAQQASSGEEDGESGSDDDNMPGKGNDNPMPYGSASASEPLPV